jgi:hypothetical protein
MNAEELEVLMLSETGQASELKYCKFSLTCGHGAILMMIMVIVIWGLSGGTMRGKGK